MSDEPLTNAAVEWERAHFGRMNRLTAVVVGDTYPITDDFLYEDRRTGGMNFGQLDGSQFVDIIKMNWEFGAGRPTYSIHNVVAVRGDRMAAIAERVEYDNDMFVDFLGVFQLDPALRLQQRYITFDAGSRDAAIAELDRMQAEAED